VLQADPYPHKMFVTIHMLVWFLLLIFYTRLKLLSTQEHCVHSVSIQNDCVIPSGQSLLDSWPRFINFWQSDMELCPWCLLLFCFSFVTFLLHCVDPCILLSTLSLCLPTHERQVWSPMQNRQNYSSLYWCNEALCWCDIDVGKTNRMCLSSLWSSFGRLDSNRVIWFDYYNSNHECAQFY
jgi:hypothetical protein